MYVVETLLHVGVAELHEVVVAVYALASQEERGSHTFHGLLPQVRESGIDTSGPLLYRQEALPMETEGFNLNGNLQPGSGTAAVAKRRKPGCSI